MMIHDLIFVKAIKQLYTKSILLLILNVLQAHFIFIDVYFTLKPFEILYHNILFINF